MGEIIRVDFTNRKVLPVVPVEGVASSSPKQPEPEERVASFLESKEDGRPPMSIVEAQKIVAATPLFERAMVILRLPTSPSVLRQAQEDVRFYKLDDLIKWLDTTEIEWKQKPSFFRAVFMEFESRLREAVSLLKR